MQKRLQSIDAMRGIAILLVLETHLLGSPGAFRQIGAPQVVARFFENGRAGVDLFFVLSAYLLTTNLLRNRDGANVVGAFYLRRAFRILPLYWLLLIVGFLVTAICLAHGANPQAFLWRDTHPFWTYVLFLQNFVIGWTGKFGGEFFAVTWSLAVEEHFYLLLPLLATRLSHRELALVAALCAVSALAIKSLLDAEVGLFAAYTWSIARIDAFGFGMLIALTPRLWPQFVQRFDARLPIAAAFAVYFVVSQTSVAIRPGLYEVVFNTTFTTIAAALLVFGVTQGRHEMRPPAAVVAFVGWFGKRCYSLYLLHMPIFGAVFLAAGHVRPVVVDANTLALAAISIAAICAASAITFRYVEEPFMRVADRLSKRRAAAAPIAAAA